MSSNDAAVVVALQTLLVSYVKMRFFKNYDPMVDSLLLMIIAWSINYCRFGLEFLYSLLAKDRRKSPLKISMEIPDVTCSGYPNPVFRTIQWCVSKKCIKSFSRVVVYGRNGGDIVPAADVRQRIELDCGDFVEVVCRSNHQQTSGAVSAVSSSFRCMYFFEVYAPSQRVLHKFLDLCCEEHAMSSESWRQDVFTFVDSRWEKHSSHRQSNKTLDNVIIDELTRRFIRSDIDRFVNGCEWYAERGLPWRRGYLLHGPPGTGKTSLIKAMSKHAHMHLYLLDFSAINNDQMLIKAFGSVPPKSLIVLEDIDCGANTEMLDRDSSASKVSMAGLLNCLDGIMELHECIVVMTTNRIHKLDDALVRPGRFDVHLKLTYVGKTEVYRFMKLFYVDAFDETCRKVLDSSFREGILSPAQICAVCTKNESCLQACWEIASMSND